MATVAGSYDLVVLGGGLAGLTFALEATRHGKTAAVLESEAQVGGLGRTLTFGDYRFDIGGHRFYSHWPEITDWVLDLMGHDMLEVGRRSHIRLDGHYVDYPIQFPGALRALRPAKMVQVLASYLGATLSPNGHHQDLSFEDWVVRRFGRALYDIYFRPYTEKVWGVDCRQLSSEWASERIQLPSLAAAVKGSLMPRAGGPATLISRFLYPALGIGMIPERIAARAVASGRAALFVRSRARGLEKDGPQGDWRVRFDRRGEELEVRARELVSTIPLPALWRLLPLADPAPFALDGRLKYRGLACVFLATAGPRISDDTWTYFPDPHIGFGRIHEPPNWSAAMAPPGGSSLCVEVFCTQGDGVWQRSDGELVDGVTADLEALGLIARRRVRDAWVLRVPEAYPCYLIGYERELQRARGYLAERWPTLHLLGRTGAFQYMNMDAVIRQGIQAADSLVHGA